MHIVFYSYKGTIVMKKGYIEPVEFIEFQFL